MRVSGSKVLKRLGACRTQCAFYNYFFKKVSLCILFYLFVYLFTFAWLVCIFSLGKFEHDHIFLAALGRGFGHSVSG